MIDTVLLDMGGTLEDIYVDDAGKKASAREALRILRPGVKELLEGLGMKLGVVSNTASQ